MATFAPEARKRSTIARPMPRAPPVTTATRPCRSMRLVRGMSVRGAPAGDVEDAGGRERAFLRREPSDQRRDLLDLDEPAHRDLREHEPDVLVGHLLEDVRLRRRRRDAVAEDA